MKRLMTVILICVLVTAGCSSSNDTGNKALDGDLKLDSDQSLLVAQVTSIFGNEITLALAEEVDDSQVKGQAKEQSEGETQEQTQSANQEQGSSTTDGNNTGEEQKDSSSQDDSTKASSDSNSTSENTSEDGKLGDMPSASTASGDTVSEDTVSEETSSVDMSSADTSSKDMPSGDTTSRNMPSGDMPSGDMPSSGNSPDMEGGGSGEDNSDKESQTQTVRYSLTGEEVTMMIPVGTPVTTLLGTITTFSRIAVDNTLKIVTEKNANGEDTIVAIYIVG